MDAQMTLASKRKTFFEVLNKQKEELSRVIPKHMNADRLLRIAQTAALGQPRLYECELASIGQCLQKCSERGLEPDGYYAHLIPFRDNKTGKYICQLIWDYKGLAELAYRSGRVVSLVANIIYEDEAQDPDRFFVEYGTNERIVHKPDILAALRGQRVPVAVYAYATMKDGSTKFDIMSWPEITEIAKRSKTYRKADNKWFGPWDTDWNEMAKKTVLKRMFKLLPLSAEFRDVVQDDNQLEFGIEDVPDVVKMKAAVPVIEKEPEEDIPSSPFEEAINETETKKETGKPKAPEAVVPPVAREQAIRKEPEGTVKDESSKRFRRTKEEIATCNDLLEIFKARGKDPKNLFEFGLEVDLEHCRMPELEMIIARLDEDGSDSPPVEAEDDIPYDYAEEKEDSDGPSVDDVLEKAPETDKPSNAEKVLAITNIRERIQAYDGAGTPIHEEDIIRYAIENDLCDDDATRLEDLISNSLINIGFFFPNVYKWVQENPRVDF